MYIAQYPEVVGDGYPGDLARVVRDRRGEALWMRPVVASDAAALAAEFAAADDDTVYARFFNPSFSLTQERLRYLTEIDYRRHLALAIMTVGGDTSQGVAIGRYAARSAIDVEAAIVVKPAYRRCGIGGLVLDSLVGAARRVGYLTMTASYLSDNAAAAVLLERIGFVRNGIDDGVVEAVRDLTSSPAGIASV